MQRIYYQQDCDLQKLANKTVAIIGGGNSALQEAVMLSDICKKVFVVQNLDFLTGEQKLQDILKNRLNVEIILGTVVSAIKDTPEFSGITLKKVADGSETELKLDGMFVAIGLQPENSAFADVTELNEQGYISANETCLTKTNGIFVAGDCRTKAIRQVATAASDGAVAAISACRYIDGL